MTAHRIIFDGLPSYVMTAPHDVVAIGTAPRPLASFAPVNLWANGVQANPLTLLDPHYARKWIDLHLANGQRVRATLLPPERQWRKPDALAPGYDGLIEVRFRRRRSSRHLGKASEYTWGELGPGTIEAWRPAG